MSEATCGSKQNKVEVLNSVTKNAYPALKSKNEIYFQMASIFKEISKDEKEAGAVFLGKLLLANH
ncbi:MAG: hypothetical protein GY729_06245 [Desulfobacteraceae bacterium]|nr:hypothetical protein [Desulfobacteraceae bacterium]